MKWEKRGLEEEESVTDLEERETSEERHARFIKRHGNKTHVHLIEWFLLGHYLLESCFSSAARIKLFFELLATNKLLNFLLKSHVTHTINYSLNQSYKPYNIAN